MKSTVLVISCEHGGNDVPAEYRHLFAQHKDVMESHRAVDFGALDIADKLAQLFNCQHTKTTVSRLLIDCNRSLSNRNCFSEFSRHLPEADKQKLIAEHYLPYRRQTESLIKKHIDQGRQVLHLSIHTFTPELNGISRNAAIGLLYDPSRHGEQEVARLWHELLLAETPAYRVRKNYPYRGNTDGFTSALRQLYSEENYLGFEVENNQALLQDKQSFDQLMHALSHSLKELLLLLQP